MLEGEAGDISGNSSNLDSYTNVLSTLRNGHKYIIVRNEKKRKSVLLKAEEIQTREKKLTFHERDKSAIIFVTHWLLLINRNRDFFNFLICLRNLRWFQFSVFSLNQSKMLVT